MKTTLSLIMLMVLCGCQTFYSSTVTVTQIRKSVLNELGLLYRAGKISAETDAKITKLDAEFLQAAHALELSLLMVKSGGSDTDPVDKLLDVKVVINQLIEILVPFVNSAVADGYKDNLEKATQL